MYHLYTMPSVPRRDMHEHEAHPNKMTEERLKHHIPEMVAEQLAKKMKKN